MERIQSQTVFSIVILIGYTFTLTYSISTTYYKPRINSTYGYDEVVVDANRDITLYCEGREPVTWTFPNNTLPDDEFWSTVTISVSEIPRADYVYRALLHLKNASYVDTGFYYCHGNQSDKNDNYRSNKIYVYVRDEEHLSVSNEEIQLLRVPQHSNTTLPCLRTSPDVTVTLTCNDEEVNYVSYDPKAGFILKITSLLQACDYECVFTLNNSTEKQLWFLQVIPKTEYVSKPHIDAPDNGRTSIGKEYILNCSVTVEPDVYFSLQWRVPNESGLKTGRIVATNSTNVSNLNGKMGSSILSIKRVEIEDQGIYECRVMDHSKNTNFATKKIMVYGTGQSYINITEKHGVNIINTTAGTESIQWMINVEAYPKPKLTWKNNQGQEIDPRWADSKSSKYSINSGATDALLKIFQITLNDSGTYQLVAENGLEEKELNLTLLVYDSPTVHIISDNYHKYGDESHLICKAAGYPLPSIQWWYKPCQDDSCTFKHTLSFHTEEQGLMTISHLNLTATETGYVKCAAKNRLGEDTNTIGFYVTDINNGFDIWGLEDNEKVAVNETVTVHCAASVYNYTDEINWYRLNEENAKPILTDDKYFVLRSSTNFTYQVSMTIRTISHNESGIYRCKMLPKDEYEEEKQLDISIIVTDPKIPKILKTNMNNTEKTIELGRPLQWHCLAEGIPAPTITWKKNGQDWSKNINYTRVRLLDDNRVLSFNYTLQEDEGTYACRASNREGWDERKMQLILLTKSVWSVTYISVIILFLILLLVLLITLYVKVKKEQKLRRELTVAGLMHFEKGALENLNPELGIDDQAELLPYDKKWEFPRDKLKLGKQLGSGAFGVVMKAEAFGITEGETISTVAVKMVKRNADYTYIKALASELKIMVHLGKHLNVVNLLGACTKNVTKRELFVIVEYCRFGNLHNYLLRHRVDFIDQIDLKTGTIDTTIGADILSRTLSISSNHSGTKTMACAGVDYRSTPNPSCTTDSTIVCSPTGDDSVILSNNSIQPEWRSNYRGDYKGNVRPISTHDLLCWSFQVARGMEYLASRKILHGDLATRNILLAEENIVKICDFGLAKSMYKSDNYKKKGDGPLPVKWMAVESIRDRVFSTQSDVWSYGIVLWEFFSLARTPYPGMEADERLYNKLVEGFRMDQPEYATKDLYQTMLECWDATPTNRPTFTILSENLGCMLQESVRKHYIELNDPYIHMNNERLGEGHSDYLAMLSSPDYGNLASPLHEYVNGGNLTCEEEKSAETSGYLPMDIFSPRTPDTIFDFELHKKQKGNGEVASGIELMPILHPHNESDAELSPTSPSKSFANPSYQTAPNVNKLIEKPSEQIVSTSDNYINMPQQKNAMRNEIITTADSVTNPNYVQMHQKDSKDDNKSSNYINSQSRDWERPYL